LNSRDNNTRFFASTSIEEIEAEAIEKWNKNEHQAAFNLVEENLVKTNDLRLLGNVVFTIRSMICSDVI